MGENSTSLTYFFARATMVLAISRTSSRSFSNWCRRWMSELERKTWMRGCAAPCTASQQASTSPGTARASPAMAEPRTSRAMSFTASISPGDEAGNPASMKSTRRRSSARAISSLSWAFSATPGDCSPSRSVVSKISTRSTPFFSDMGVLPPVRPPGGPLALWLAAPAGARR